MKKVTARITSVVPALDTRLYTAKAVQVVHLHRYCSLFRNEMIYKKK